MSLNGSFLSVLTMVGTYYISGNKLDVAAVFATLQLIEFVRLNSIFFVGLGIGLVYELKVIFKRIIDILDIKDEHQ